MTRNKIEVEFKNDGKEKETSIDCQINYMEYVFGYGFEDTQEQVISVLIGLKQQVEDQIKRVMALKEEDVK